MAAHGQYSTHLRRLEKLDGRSKEARILKSMRQELYVLLGRKPNPVEMALIERACWLHLRIAVMDERLIEGKANHHELSIYNANVNSFARVVEKLGFLG